MPYTQRRKQNMMIPSYPVPGGSLVFIQDRGRVLPLYFSDDIMDDDGDEYSEDSFVEEGSTCTEFILLISACAEFIFELINTIVVSTFCVSLIFYSHQYGFGLVSAFTVFATAVYNVAIARSNTEILINVVIILFISEIDEQFFRGIQAASPRWVENLRWKKNNKDDDVQDRLHELDARLRNAEQRTVSITNEEQEQSPQDSLLPSPPSTTRSAIEGLGRRLENRKVDSITRREDDKH